MVRDSVVWQAPKNNCVEIQQRAKKGMRRENLDLTAISDCHCEDLLGSSMA